MAEEVYKILQGRLRLKQAQENTCGDQYDCEGCLNHVSTKQQLDESARRKRNSNSTTGEVSKKKTRSKKSVISTSVQQSLDR